MKERIIMGDLFIYHLHDTPEENKRAKYHIIDNEINVLCGTKLNSSYSGSGEPITLEWYNKNIAVDPDDYVCKKCAKKALSLLCAM